MRLNLDPAFYTDPAVFARERDRIFARTWQFAGPAAQVAAPGGYAAVSVAGLALMAVRGRDGVLRAFRNVCRHRGARLLPEGAGDCGGRLRCPYHQWVFGDDGRLLHAPWFGEDPAFDPAAWPLEPAHAAVWRGLLFLALDPEGTLEDQLGDLPGELADEPIETYAATDTGRIAFDANWKTYTDNFVEGYHIPGVHPSFHAAIDFEAFRTTAHRGFVRMTAPPKGALFYRGKWLWMWPNWTLSLFGGGMNTSRINPVAVDRTVQDYWFWFADTSEAGAAARAASRDGTMAVVAEDAGVCADTQANYAGGNYRPGPLSPRHEAGVAWFQDRVAAALAG